MTKKPKPLNDKKDDYYKRQLDRNEAIKQRKRKILAKRRDNSTKRMMLAINLQASDSNISSIINYISTKNMIMDNRKVLLEKMQTCVASLAEIVSGMPDNFIATESRPPLSINKTARKVLRTGQSIYEGLQDKVIKSDAAKIEIAKWRKQVKQLHKIIVDERPHHPISENQQNSVEREATSAAKPTVKLSTFDDLRNYVNLFAEPEQKIKMLESAPTGERSNQAEIDKIWPPEKQPESPDDKLPGPSETYDAGVDNSGANYDRHVAEFQTQLTKAAEEIPPLALKQGKRYQIALRVPLLCVTYRWVPDSVLKETRYKYQRVLTFLHNAPNPGYGVASNDISMFIIHQQLLLILPLVVASNPTRLAEFKSNDFADLQEEVGKLAIIRAGKSAGARSLEFDLPEGKVNKKKDADKYQAKMNKANMANVREFFTDKKYPGLAFIWVMPEAKAKLLNNVRFREFGLPTPGNGSTVFNTAQMTKNRQENAEQNKQKITDLQQKRGEVTQQIEKDLDQKIRPIKIAIEEANKQLHEQITRYTNIVKNEIPLMRQSLRSQADGLKQIKDTNSQEYKDAHANAKKTLDMINNLQAEAQAILTLTVPAFEKTRNKINKELDTIIAEEKSKRFGKNK